MLVWNTSKRHTVDMGLVDTVVCRYDYNDTERTYLELLLCIPRKGQVECVIRHGVGRKLYSEFRTQVEQASVQELIHDLFIEADLSSVKCLSSTLVLSNTR